MIRTGTLVERIPNKHLLDIEPRCLREMYPPEGAVCVVVSPSREKDVIGQLRLPVRGVALQICVDVMFEGHVYSNCIKSAFKEVKSRV